MFPSSVVNRVVIPRDTENKKVLVLGFYPDPVLPKGAVFFGFSLPLHESGGVKGCTLSFFLSEDESKFNELYLIDDSPPPTHSFTPVSDGDARFPRVGKYYMQDTWSLFARRVRVLFVQPCPVVEGSFVVVSVVYPLSSDGSFVESCMSIRLFRDMRAFIACHVPM